MFKQALDELKAEMEAGRGLWATVEKTDAAAGTCVVSSEEESVPLKVLLPMAAGWLLIPEKGATVYVLRIAPGVGQVVQFDKLERILAVASGKMELSAEGGIELNGGRLGGVPLIDPLVSSFADIVAWCNGMATAYNALVTAYNLHTHLVILPAPGTPGTPPVAPAVPYPNPLLPPTKAQLENTKVKQ